MFYLSAELSLSLSLSHTHTHTHYPLTRVADCVAPTTTADAAVSCTQSHGRSSTADCSMVEAEADVVRDSHNVPVLICLLPVSRAAVMARSNKPPNTSAPYSRTSMLMTCCFSLTSMVASICTRNSVVSSSVQDKATAVSLGTTLSAAEIELWR